MKDHEIEKILPRFAAQADFYSPAHNGGQIDFFDGLAADAGKGLDDDFHIDGVQKRIEDLPKYAFRRLKALLRMEILKGRSQYRMMLQHVVHIGHRQDFAFNHVTGHFSNPLLAVRNQGRLEGNAQGPPKQSRYGIPVSQAADQAAPAKWVNNPPQKKSWNGYASSRIIAAAASI